jgi:subtilase family serine protease
MMFRLLLREGERGKEFQMAKSTRLAVVVGGFLYVLGWNQAVNAQVGTQAQPFFIVQASGPYKVSGATTPSQIRHAYGFDQINNHGVGQTIAIVDAFDHPTIENDLAVFSSAFGLPACTIANGCLQIIYASDPPPPNALPNAVWAFEIALDVEWAHAIAPDAQILLVEAKSDCLAHLMDAVDAAMRHRPSAVSMSWGVKEFLNSKSSPDCPGGLSESDYDLHFLGANVTFTAASGDSGQGVAYPAASPYVMGVGGSTLHVNANGNYQNETAWSGSGGGTSLYEFPEPRYQTDYQIQTNPPNHRATPDVAYVGDPNTGVAVYDSIPLGKFSGWSEVGGTSVGAPQWAALIAIVNSMRAYLHSPPLTGSDGVLYEAATTQSYHDLTQGRDGTPGQNPTCATICKAQDGYDFVTGLGTPQANNLIPALVQLP